MVWNDSFLYRFSYHVVTLDKDNEISAAYWRPLSGDFDPLYQLFTKCAQYTGFSFKAVFYYDNKDNIFIGEDSTHQEMIFQEGSQSKKLKLYIKNPQNIKLLP